MKNSDFFSKTLGNNEQKMERYHSGSPVNSSTMALFLSIPEQTTAQFGHLQSAVMPSEEAVMTHIKIRPAAGHSTSLIPTISPDVSTKHSTERKKRTRKWFNDPWLLVAAFAKTHKTSWPPMNLVSSRFLRPRDPDTVNDW